MRKGNAKASIADPIHEAQCSRRKEAISAVILDHDRLTSDPARVSQQEFRVMSVVENISEQDDIEITIGKRQMNPVESAHSDVSAVPR